MALTRSHRWRTSIATVTVFGPGGNRFTDYRRIDTPLDLLHSAVAVTLIPRLWPF